MKCKNGNFRIINLAYNKPTILLDRIPFLDHLWGDAPSIPSHTIQA